MSTLPYKDVYDQNNKVICSKCGLSTWDYRSFKPPTCETCHIRLECLANSVCLFDSLILCHSCREEYVVILHEDSIEVSWRI